MRVATVLGAGVVMAAAHALLWSTATACIYWTLAMQKKVCKSAMFARAWQACQRGLSLHHSPSHHFARCQWEAGTAPSTPYLIYRWLLFIAVTSIGIASFACQRLPKLYRELNFELNYMKWFIYFTNWGYMMIIVQSALALLVLHRYGADKAFNIPGEDEECSVPRRVRTPLLCRVYWLTHTVATDLAFVITLIYWTLVHDPKIHEINALNVLVHGGNSVVMLCEVAVTAHPVRAAHALYGAGAGLIYGLFSAIYWALGGTDRIGLPAIYPALDWNQPGSALGFVALCAVVMMFSHALATCLAALRVRLAARLCPRHQIERLPLPTH